MKCIDFDRHFSQYTAKWVQENSGKYKNYDQMEEHFPDVYFTWLNTSMDWLGGKTPALYFTDYDDAKLLVGWMRDYFKQSVPVPDMLLDRIAQLEEAQEELVKVLNRPQDGLEAKLCVIGLLKQMQSASANALYVEWIAASGSDDELADLAVESLMGQAEAVAEALLAAFDGATPEGQARMLDVLSCIQGDDRVFRLVLDRFLQGDNRALYAAYLCKLNDARALEPLKQAIDSPDVGYLDFIEIRNAIESLGGEVITERDFSGDQDYEALRQMG